MPQLHELLSQRSTGVLKHYALEVASEIEDSTRKLPGGKFSLTNVQTTQPELAEAVVRAVWWELWQHAKPDPTVRAPYTHVVSGSERRVVEIIRASFDGLINDKSETLLARQVRTALAFNRIAETQGRGYAPIWIRYWPADEPLKYLVLNAHQQEHWRDQKRRVVEEKKAESTLVVRHDMSIIKGPEPTLEGVVKWCEEWIGKYRKLQTQYDTLHARVKVLEETNASLESELEQYQNRAVWSEAAAEINRLLATIQVEEDGDDG